MFKIITIDKDFQDDDLPTFWVSTRVGDNDNATYYTGSRTEEHFAIKEDDGVEIAAKFERTGVNDYFVTLGEEKYKLHGHRQIKLVKKDVSSIAVTRNNQGVVGLKSGDLVKLTVSDQGIDILPWISQAHYEDVTKIKVFPSQEVVLTVGLDKQIKLWSFSEDKPLRTLLEQTSTITDVAIVGKGRNILSSSKDGSVNLWECSKGEVVHKFTRIDNHEDGVNCIHVEENGQLESVGENKPDHYECDNKILYVGYDSGIIQPYSLLHHHQLRTKFRYSAAVTSLTAFKQYLVAGYADGTIIIWHQDGEEVQRYHFNRNYAIDNVLVTSKGSILVSNGPEILLELAIGETFEAEVVWLVGLPEVFRASAFAETTNGYLVAGDDLVVEYQ